MPVIGYSRLRVFFIYAEIFSPVVFAAQKFASSSFVAVLDLTRLCISFEKNIISLCFLLYNITLFFAKIIKK